MLTTQEGVPKIDVLQLLDRLEALVSRGWHVPLTNKVIIDDPEFFEIVDQLRVTIPDELKQAKRVSQQRSQVIAEAQREAQQILGEAQAERQRLLDSDELVNAARTRANEIVQEAERQADEIRQGANGYAHEVLNGLDAELSRTLASIRRGREMLRSLIERGNGAATVASELSDSEP